jgi:hypothetical protein
MQDLGERPQPTYPLGCIEGEKSVTPLRKMLIIAVAALAAACSPAKAPEAPSGKTTIRFATDWRAQAEQGGFYQALATGEYAKRGLDVTIVQGGPGVNVPQLLACLRWTGVSRRRHILRDGCRRVLLVPIIYPNVLNLRIQFSVV